MKSPQLTSSEDSNNGKQLILHDLSPRKVADKLESYFIADMPQLTALLSLLKLTDIEEFMQSIVSFFDKKLKIRFLTIADIEALDLRVVAYDFVRYMNIPLPLIKDEFAKQPTIDLISKLGRVLIHGVIFPELEKEPGLAITVKNLLIRNIHNIALIEGWDAKKICDNLKIDALANERQIGFVIPKTTKLSDKSLKEIAYSNLNHTAETKEFYICNFSDKEVRKIANYLAERKVIFGTKPFINLLFSHGRNVAPVKCNPENVKYLVCLLHKLYNTKTNSKYLLEMNYGKAFWKFAQENFIQDCGDHREIYFDREFRKMHSEIKKKHPKVIIEINQLIQDVFGT